MNLIRNIFFITSLLLFLTLVSCKRDQKDILIVGTSADTPPFSFIDSTAISEKKIQGFEIDLINYIAKVLNLNVIIKDMNFNALIPALHSKRIDLAIASIATTEERKKNLDFSDGYYTQDVSILIEKNSEKINSIDELNNKRIGVQLGTSHELFIKNLSKKLNFTKVTSLDKLGELVQELKVNRIDVIILEGTAAKMFAKLNTSLEYNVLKGQTESLSIAFPKGSKLVKKVNNILKNMKNSDIMNLLIKKWFYSNNINDS